MAFNNAKATEALPTILTIEALRCVVVGKVVESSQVSYKGFVVSIIECN